MERRLKERLIGAAVLVMMGVIFIPMILDDRSETDITITETNIPRRPDDNFSSRIVPLKESDLTPVVNGPAQQPLVENLPEAIEPVTEETPASEVDNQILTTRTPARTATNNQMGATAWVVQLGSFSNEENAKALNEKLRKAGYPAFVEPLKRNSDIAYRVRVGPELLRSDAQSLQEKLKNKMQIEGIVIRYP